MNTLALNTPGRSVPGRTWFWCSRHGYVDGPPWPRLACPACGAALEPSLNQAPTPAEVHAVQDFLQAWPAIRREILAAVRRRGEVRLRPLRLPSLHPRP